MSEELIKSEIIKAIYCPNCGNHIHLLKNDFKVTTDNERGDWSCDPAIICPWDDCGAEFFVTFSQIQFLSKPDSKEESEEVQEPPSQA